MTSLFSCKDEHSQVELNDNTALEAQLLKTLTAKADFQPGDYLDLRLNNARLQIHDDARIGYLYMSGEAMAGDNIHNGSLLIVDRSAEPQPGDVVACYVDGELTVRRWQHKESLIVLTPSNPIFIDRDIQPHQQFELWGVVIWSIEPQKCVKVNG